MTRPMAQQSKMPAMEKWTTILGLLAAAILAGSPDLAQAAKAAKPAKAAVTTEITLRHALAGPARELLRKLATRFNDEQKGSSRLLLEDLSAVGESRHLPQMALLDADDSLTFFHTLPRFKPLHQAMAEAGQKFAASQFLPSIVEAVDDPAGRLQALPLGLALPVLFWNKDALRKAGLNPEQAPTTWLQLQHLAGSLYDAGQLCPLTSSRLAWVHLENISTQNGEPVSARDAHGVMRLVLNRMVDVKHVSLLASWQKSRYFQYYGRADEADRKFIGGECAMLTGPSSLFATAASVDFPVGVAPLPHYDDVYGATPANLLPDGAALWLLAGNKKAEDKVAARFVAFMLRPAVQREWVAVTGFLPMTAMTLDSLKDGGATRRLLTRKSGAARGKHGYGLSRQREIVAEELEAVWRSDKPPMAALNEAMRRINLEAAGSHK